MKPILLLIALLGSPPTSPEALYRAGRDAYRAGHYAVAITAFEAALAGADRPDLLFSLGQAHRLQYFIDGGSAHLEAAIKAYREYLERVPDGNRRVYATQHLSTLVPYLDRLRIEQAEGGTEAKAQKARIIITSAVADARAQLGDGPPEPVPAAFEVEPGVPQRIEVTAASHEPVVREVTGVAGTPIALVIDPKPQPGNLRLQAPDGARIIVDGDPVGQSPLDAPIALPPGAHELVVLRRGRRPVSRAFDLGRGETVEMEVELERTPQRWVAIGAMELATGLALSGAVTGYLAWDAREEAREIEDRVGVGLTAGELSHYHDLESRRDGLLDVTIGLGMAAAGLLATGLTLWFVDDPAPPPRTTRTAPAPAGDDLDAP
ncbi:MAG: PEGA domain-containing protein [Myxococcales bacterium]|nr:PEGA domain-containing protein [Myxococcales bacterium]